MINYIRQLNTVYGIFHSDDRLNPAHISLYMALFQEWNSSRFAQTFSINRREMMTTAKIGSTSTYHRCVRDLDNWHYLSYFPSNNPHRGSKIRMTVFETADEPVTGHYHPKSGQLEEHYRPGERQVVGPFINNTKQENILKGKIPAHEKEVIDFFQKRSSGKQEALTFFNHYQAVGWKMSSGSAIQNWHSAAEKWILKVKKWSKENQPSHTRTGKNHIDYLKTSKNKDYGKPL